MDRSNYVDEHCLLIDHHGGQMKRLVILVAALLFISGSPAPAQATQGVAKKYASCADLLEKYPNGVAKNKKARNKAVKGGFAKPTVSKRLYKKNGSRLDRDKDGVMCEQDKGSASDSSEATTSELCVVSQQGYSWVPGREWVPWGIQLTNPNRKVDADSINISVLLINQDNVIVSQSTELFLSLPAGQSMWVGAAGLIRGVAPESVTSLTARITAECESSGRTTDPVLSGPGSASSFTSTSSRLSAIVANTGNKPISGIQRIYFVAFNADGNIIGGARSIAYTEIPVGLSVAKETTMYMPVDEVASVQYSVEPS